MNTGRWIWMAGVGAGLLVVGWMALGGSRITVEVAAAARDTLTVTVSEEGRTRLHDQYIVAAPVTGRVGRITLVAGDSVQAGEVVARIAPPPSDERTTRSAQADLSVALARVLEAEAEAATARQRRDQAVREYERRVPLFDMGAITREALERAQRESEAATAAVARAQASVAAAESSVDAARARLIGMDPDDEGVQEPIRSPVSGVVLRVLEKSERVVQAGAPLLEVSGPEGLEFVVDLLTEEAVRVSPGDPVRITGWGEDRTLMGQVAYIEPAAFTEVSALGVDEQRVNVVGRLLDPPPNLGAGFRLDVAIVVWSGDDVLSVPASAAFRRPSGWHLFVAEQGTARLRAVEVGQRGADRIEILSGLTVGDEVILFPSDKVDDGVAISRQNGAG